MPFVSGAYRWFLNERPNFLKVIHIVVSLERHGMTILLDVSPYLMDNRTYRIYGIFIAFARLR